MIYGISHLVLVYRSSDISYIAQKIFNAFYIPEEYIPKFQQIDVIDNIYYPLKFVIIGSIDQYSAGPKQEVFRNNNGCWEKV